MQIIQVLTVLNDSIRDVEIIDDLSHPTFQFSNSLNKSLLSTDSSFLGSHPRFWNTQHFVDVGDTQKA
jgi:hypothetical protein